MVVRLGEELTLLDVTYVSCWRFAWHLERPNDHYPKMREGACIASINEIGF